MDLLRIFAAYEVLAIHLTSANGLLIGNIKNVFTYVNILALAIFMVLSGYLVLKSYDKAKNILSFYLHRIETVYPIYIVMIGACFFYFTYNKIPLPEDCSHLYWWRYILCINTLIPTQDNFWVNLCATWMIPCFFAFYLLVPIFKHIFKNRYLVIIGIIFSVVIHLFIKHYGVLLAVKYRWDLGGIYANPFSYLYPFLFGVLLYYDEKCNKTSHSIVLFIFADILLIPILGYHHSLFLMLVGSQSAYLLIHYLKFFKFSGYWSKLNNPLLKLSNASFALYICHPFLLLVATTEMLEIQSISIRYIIAILFSTLIAYNVGNLNKTCISIIKTILQKKLST